MNTGHSKLVLGLFTIVTRAVLIEVFEQEAATGKIILDDEDPDVLEAVLRHLYGLPYVVPEHTEPCIFHAKMYNAGDYYQLSRLKANALAIAEPLLNKLDCSSKASTLLELVKLAYEGTSDADRGELYRLR